MAQPSSSAYTGRRASPCGSWVSPISARLVAQSARSLAQIQLDAGGVYWIEARPEEGGRQVIMRRAVATGAIQDVTPAGYNARSRVHEYGGGAYTVDRATVYFVNDSDQQIYLQHEGQPPHKLIDLPGQRFADLCIDRRRARLIAVCERPGGAQPENLLISVNASEGGALLELARGADFYSSPCLSRDGGRLAWLSWNHPNMPWDGCELWVGTLDASGRVTQPRCVAGGAEESIFQPCWGEDGALYFVSDRSGWWNLYRWDEVRTAALCPVQAEFGRAQWVFGLATYAPLSTGALTCAYSRDGTWRLGVLAPGTAEIRPLALSDTEISYVRADASGIYCVASSPSQSERVLQVDPATGQAQAIYPRSDETIAREYLSIPQPISFPTAGGGHAHGFYYPPHNPDYEPLAGGRPPLIVISHGGPTASTSTGLNPALQFWTSRGFGLLDVNYRGSTGYGRDYRRALNGQWGSADVEDCIHGAHHLVREQLADPARLIIRGRSAGGYTTLAALAFHAVFRAGASYYGVSDLELLARDTHKFEARYLDRLVGPYPAQAALYRARSPIHACAQLSAPTIFLQGLEDKVVPPNQAEHMVAALRAKGVPVAYVTFAHEQHGFRRAENIARALEAELYFYSRVFRFELAEAVKPVRIENLD